MTINWDKPVQTRDGRKVRVLCTDGPDPIFPVVGYVLGSTVMRHWASEGGHCNEADCPQDLINTPEPATTITRWVNIYEDDSDYFYKTRGAADNAANSARIACVEVTITYRPGDGL